jgi:uncharacterized protein YkwD
MRKLAMSIAAAALALLLVACSPEEATHLQAVNQFRTANGAPALQWDEGVYQKAHDWSQHLADAGKLSHSNLADGVPDGWHRLGENVAMASTLDAAMNALENSPPHRANLLNPAFDRVAIGVVHQNGLYWITETFVG